MSTNKLTPGIFERSAEVERIGNRGAHEAQEESRRLGIPNVYAHDGKLYYELPDGTITSQSPFENDAKDAGETKNP